MNTRAMGITFLHPYHSMTFPADVGVAMTGTSCIKQLIAHRFLVVAGRFHEHIMTNERTGRRVALERPLADSEVRDGDRIQVELVPRFM